MTNKTTTAGAGNPGGTDGLLQWAIAPPALKEIILTDLDEVKLYRDRSHDPDYFSNYIKTKYGIYIDPNVLRATLSSFRRRLGSSVRVPYYVDFLRLAGDWLVTSDWHLPATDFELVYAMAQVAKRHGVRNVLIAGDLLDNVLYAKHLKIREDQTSEDQWRLAEDVIDWLLSEFEQVAWTWGNHEQRIVRKLDGKLRFNRIASMLSSAIGDKLIVSEYPYCHINDKWRVTHPMNFSAIPMRVAMGIAAKFRMSVACAHGHRFGITFDASGRDMVVDTGGLYDITKMEYIMFSDSTHSVMNQGFLILQNNFPYLYSPIMTDWQALGIDYRRPPWLDSLEGGQHEHSSRAGHSDFDGLGGS